MHVRSVHSNPETAKYLVDLYLKEISEFLRNDIITEAKNLQRFLDETARKTDDVLLKKKLYRKLSQVQDKMLFAYAHTPYGFKVTDPALVPDRDKYIRPKYLRNCLLSVTGAFLWMAGMAIAIEFFRYARPYLADRK